MSTIVFDFGGTWFRSGIVLDSGTLVTPSRRPAISYRNFPSTPVPELQKQLVDFIVAETDRLKGQAPGCTSASISFGAAVNAHSGMILNSGPIWGPGSRPLDLAKALTAAAPYMRWTVVNDVTANLLFHVAVATPPIRRRAMLLTVSSGIASRVFDARSKSVPVDPISGLQGEIGHLPVTFIHRGTTFNSVCDCGGENHLNAFCSGNAMPSTLDRLARLMEAQEGVALANLLRASVRGDWTEALLTGLKASNPAARDALEALIAPVAEVVRSALVIDSEIERVFLVGGVVQHLAPFYYDTMIDLLARSGRYPVTSQDTEYFRECVVVGHLGDEPGLRGAALAAREDHGQPPAQSSKTEAESRRSSHSLREWLLPVDALRQVRILRRDVLLGSDANDLCDMLRTEHSDLDPLVPVIIDEAVIRIYGQRIRAWFAEQGVRVAVLELPCSEEQKGLQAVEACLRFLASSATSRKGVPLVAIGGGVLLDVVGLAAATYRRGVSYVRIPTTLLSIVDAAIGIKVGVNFGGARNRVGAFHPPVAVFLNPAFLATLERRQISSGFAEIIKVAVARDRELFALVSDHAEDFLSTRGHDDAMLAVIERAVSGVVEELALDPLESTPGRALDFGHTFGPTLEMAALPRLLHGEAVSIDIALTSTLAMQRGALAARDHAAILGTLQRLALPIWDPALTPDLLAAALDEARAVRGGRVRIPLPTRIGAIQFDDDVSLGEVVSAAAFVEALGNGQDA